MDSIKQFFSSHENMPSYYARHEFGGESIVVYGARFNPEQFVRSTGQWPEYYFGQLFHDGAAVTLTIAKKCRVLYKLEVDNFTPEAEEKMKEVIEKYFDLRIHMLKL